MVSCGFCVFHSLYTLYTLYYAIRGCFLKTILFHIISIQMFCQYWVRQNVLFCRLWIYEELGMRWQVKEGTSVRLFLSVFHRIIRDASTIREFSIIFLYFVHICWCWMVHVFMLCSCYFRVILSWLTTTWLCTLRWRHRSWPVDEAWATSRSSETFWRLNALKLFICLFWQLWVFKGAIFWRQRLVASL